jgi:hypothetical protein
MFQERNESNFSSDVLNQHDTKDPTAATSQQRDQATRLVKSSLDGHTQNLDLNEIRIGIPSVSIVVSLCSFPHVQ